MKEFLKRSGVSDYHGVLFHLADPWKSLSGQKSLTSESLLLKMLIVVVLRFVDIVDVQKWYA